GKPAPCETCGTLSNGGTRTLHPEAAPMRFALTFLAAALLISSAYAADPPAEEPLPQPRPVASPVVVRAIPYRVSAYEVWQNYGIDRQGLFRPRVIYSPYGSYYYANGAPFPWVETHTRDFAPYIVGNSYFAGRTYQDGIVIDPRAYMPYAED